MSDTCAQREYYATEEDAIRDGLVKMSLSEVQAETTRLLCEFDKVCAERGWPYSLAYGTLLGAVRHSGPIPWDDDVDVVVPRNVYDEMVDSLPWGGNRCEFMDPRTPSYPWMYGKFVSTDTISFGCTVKRPKGYGVFLDVFPVDGCPRRGIKEWRRCCEALGGLLWSASYRIQGCEGMLLRAKYLAKTAVVRIVSQSAVKRMAHALASRYPICDSKLACNVFSPYSVEKEIMPSGEFECLSPISYDGHTLLAFANPEDHLVRLYGENWRKPVIAKQHGVAYKRIV